LTKRALCCRLRQRARRGLQRNGRAQRNLLLRRFGRLVEANIEIGRNQISDRVAAGFGGRLFHWWGRAKAKIKIERIAFGLLFRSLNHRLWN
jgi:hypothetical protein